MKSLRFVLESCFSLPYCTGEVEARDGVLLAGANGISGVISTVEDATSFCNKLESGGVLDPSGVVVGSVAGVLAAVDSEVCCCDGAGEAETAARAAASWSPVTQRREPSDLVTQSSFVVTLADVND